MKKQGLVAVLLLVLSCLSACGMPPPPETVFAVADFSSPDSRPARFKCRNMIETRQAFFGDLHVHTGYSNDAYSFGGRTSPDDAYTFAFGGDIKAPLADDAQARTLRIDRPLDFAAVTDHAEFFGEAQLCFDRNNSAYSGDFCQAFRTGSGREPALLIKIAAPFSLRDKETCGDDGERCGVAAEDIWRKTIASAERWNDSSDECVQTTFVAYEYSSYRLGSNLHRNVIFRNAVVPKRPISYMDAIREWDLWRILKERCIDGSDRCDVLAIPHNSNISNGRMFAVDYPGAASTVEKAARARLRAQIEPLVEVMQHKGDSECRQGLSGVLGSEDELCGFEKFENLAFESVTGSSQPDDCYEGPLADWIPHLGPNCLSKLSYVRHALIEGLQQEAEIGVNPFKFGLMASTDTHNAIAGGVAERDFPGHLGRADARAQERVQYDSGIVGNASNSPGGLIGVWATQNTRNSLFDAMQRKEVFGTSGPRIKPRFFAGWGIAPAMCDDPEMLNKLYAQAVPMGGDLPAASRAQKHGPTFVLSAQADIGSNERPGTPLQRLQLIKGWVDDEGQQRQAIYDVAGSPHNGASVDLGTCTLHGSGHVQLCKVWQDPDFDPDRRAVYYLRAVENPSCRYSRWQCLQLPKAQRPADCLQDEKRAVIQERAWSSPIWYSPAA